LGRRAAQGAQGTSAHRVLERAGTFRAPALRAPELVSSDGGGHAVDVGDTIRLGHQHTNTNLYNQANPGSPLHRPASPIQDLTFTDCSIFQGVAGVFSQDENLCLPFQVECRSVPDARKPRLGNDADLQKIPEQIFFSPVERERVLFIGTQFSILYTSMYSPRLVQSPLPPDIEEYLHSI
jgi:hypothetical protein